MNLILRLNLVLLATLVVITACDTEVDKVVESETQDVQDRSVVRVQEPRTSVDQPSSTNNTTANPVILEHQCTGRAILSSEDFIFPADSDECAVSWFLFSPGDYKIASIEIWADEASIGLDSLYSEQYSTVVGAPSEDDGMGMLALWSGDSDDHEDFEIPLNLPAEVSIDAAGISFSQLYLYELQLGAGVRSLREGANIKIEGPNSSGGHSFYEIFTVGELMGRAMYEGGFNFTRLFRAGELVYETKAHEGKGIILASGTDSFHVFIEYASANGSFQGLRKLRLHYQK